MGGRSSSSSSQETNTLDNRVAVQDGIGLSASSGNTITVTDGGAFDLVGNVVETAGWVIGGTVNRTMDSVDFATAAANNAFNNALAAAQASSQAASEAAAASAAQAAQSSRDALSFADGQIGRALETVDSTLGDGFGRLLDISENLFSAGGNLIDKTQETVATAYMDAANTAKGTIDNRTMIVLAVAAAGTLAAVVYFRSKK